ncbi:hypothetical protein RHMOL_Rhmol03G0136300 [Rhododendron molle]|uniref:Uncharacterized protein n=1 Tax=Rhododendron molle TaxID=49168 RepID=A0ACC0PF29_RHOML|nr:hypothetical protein RHMOL_Rhmol03G0136300 [Rhododendron molle]
MADHGSGEGRGEVVDQSEDRRGPMAIETAEQQAVETVRTGGATVEEGGDGGGNCERATGDEENRRASESESHAMEQARAVGSNSEPMGTNTEVRTSPTVGGSSDGVDSSGVARDDTGPNQTPPRDSAKGNGAAVEEEHIEEEQMAKEQTTEAAPVEIREEDIAFRPPGGVATSSRHVPITYADIAEHAPDELLAKLLEDHPVIGEYVLKAKEDRARAIEAAEAVVRAEREAEGERAGEGLAADIEAEERDAEEAQGLRVSAVAEAGALKRPEFSEETYTLPRPHLFVPLGFAGYRPPQQTDYDPELILRDPGVHIANTWAEVYLFLLFT